MSTVIPNGVAHDFLPICSKEFIDRFSIVENKYVLFVGRIVPEKSVHTLIQAFVSLYEDTMLRDLKLVIVGGFEGSKYKNSLLRTANNIPAIKFVGSQHGQALLELYSHASIFVMPSTQEGCPIALLQAMKLGLPCLVSDIPEHRILQLPPSSYFKVGDNISLSRKLRETLSGTCIVRREYKHQHHDWKTIALETESVFRELLHLQISK
jgi:glycosyltransferase involved in cell wall biosynthesis